MCSFTESPFCQSTVFLVKFRSPVSSKVTLLLDSGSYCIHFSNALRKARALRSLVELLLTQGNHSSDPFWDWLSWCLSFCLNYRPKLWNTTSLTLYAVHIQLSLETGEEGDDSYEIFKNNDTCIGNVGICPCLWVWQWVELNRYT